jgi:DNA invertase Pin-like site-specific DNA recombinase
MTMIGYARVSTSDQDLTIQLAALNAAGCEVIRQEKASGTTTAGRQELKTVLEFIRAGDTLVVTRIDRLARSIGDLQDIVRTLRTKGAAPAVIALLWDSNASNVSVSDRRLRDVETAARAPGGKS